MPTEVTSSGAARRPPLASAFTVVSGLARILARPIFTMSIGSLFTLCMVCAGLIAWYVPGRAVVNEVMDYRAHTRAIDAEISLDLALRAMEMVALERGPTFTLLTNGAPAVTAARQPMDTARAATNKAITDLRAHIAGLGDPDSIPAIARRGILVGALDALSATWSATNRMLDEGLDRPLSDRDPALAQAYATAEATLQRQFLPLLNGLQARVAAGAADAASVVEIARYAADLRELAGLQASLVTGALADRRPFTPRELKAALQISGRARPVAHPNRRCDRVCR